MLELFFLFTWKSSHSLTDKAGQEYDKNLPPQTISFQFELPIPRDQEFHQAAPCKEKHQESL